MNSPLTARQEECLRLTRFKTDKQIAEELGLAEATVKKHVAEACQRMGVNRRKAALALLEQTGQDGQAGTVASDRQTFTVIDSQPLRSTYRAPPRGWMPRVAIIGIIAVLLVLIVQAMTRLMFEVHGQVAQIDQAVMPANAAELSSPPRS